MVDIPGLPVRRAALRLDDAVLRRGETLREAAVAALARRSGADAALARAIAGEALRWKVDLDRLIDSATRRPLPADAKARAVLRQMLAQALRLDTPPHAVVATGLPLLAGGPRRLAHGVFSNLLRQGVTLPAAPTLPEPFAARWATAWPGGMDSIRAALADPPPLDLTLKRTEGTQDWAARLDARIMAPGRLRLARGHAVTELPGFGDGEFWVQDLAASIPAALLGGGNGRRALDLCAAPGGKTLQLAAAGWAVTALDVSARRLAMLRDSLSRTGLAAEIVTADALDWNPDGSFDAILLDAPCSATGTARRHPDVLHRVGAQQIVSLADLQRRLLERAARWLSPGGRLVYAVCSLEPEEGELQPVPGTLAPDPVAADELPAGLLPNRDGRVRTSPAMLPDEGGLDGFFIARYRRAERSLIPRLR